MYLLVNGDDYRQDMEDRCVVMDDSSNMINDCNRRFIEGISELIYMAKDKQFDKDSDDEDVDDPKDDGNTV